MLITFSPSDLPSPEDLESFVLTDAEIARILASSSPIDPDSPDG